MQTWTRQELNQKLCMTPITMISHNSCIYADQCYGHEFEDSKLAQTLLVGTVNIKASLIRLVPYKCSAVFFRSAGDTASTQHQMAHSIQHRSLFKSTPRKSCKQSSERRCSMMIVHGSSCTATETREFILTTSSKPWSIRDAADGNG